MQFTDFPVLFIFNFQGNNTNTHFYTWIIQKYQSQARFDDWVLHCEFNECTILWILTKFDSKPT